MQLGFPEMMFIFLVALLIFGPRKLPEIGRQVGKAMAEFKRASNEFRSQLETEMRQIEIEENRRKYEAEMQPPANTIAVNETGETVSTPEPVVITDAEPPPESQVANPERSEVVLTDAESPREASKAGDV